MRICCQDLLTACVRSIFMLADDFGNYDISFHNPKVVSPNMGRLAAEGDDVADRAILPKAARNVNACFTSSQPELHPPIHPLAPPRRYPPHPYALLQLPRSGRSSADPS